MQVMSHGFLYHGSTSDITNGYLMPRPSYVVDEEKVVFATQVYWMAALFGIPWSDSDIEFGSLDDSDEFIIEEQYPNAFNVLKKSTKIYKVSADQFINDARLGLQGYEFISRKKVPILSVDEIHNVYSLLRATPGLRMIEYKVKIPPTYITTSKLIV